MATARNGSRQDSPLTRILANTAWLLGGKGLGGILSLVYIAILTRSLGLKAFGHFSLIFGTSQAIIAVAGFETWRIVVRYGAAHVHNEDWPAFGRLSLFAGMISRNSSVCAAWAVAIRARFCVAPLVATLTGVTLG